MKTINNKLYYSRNEAAAILHVAIPTVSRWAKRGLITELRYGSLHLFEKTSIDAFLQRLEHQHG